MNHPADGPPRAYATRGVDPAALWGRRLHLGCAGWNVPRAFAAAFGEGPSQLARYATRFNSVEIDSSFYRPHRRQTYERWAASTPPDFAFSVKLPQAITHELRLVRAMPVFDPFWDQVQGLGTQLRCLLVQLPPSLSFDAHVTDRFAAALRRRYAGPVAIEPRHVSWFTQDVDALLASWRFGRVLADPVRHDAGAAPGGWPQTVYLRLHGSPRMYWSRYEDVLLGLLAPRLSAAAVHAEHCWCIFDNSAAGESVGDALRLDAMLAGVPQSRDR
ncbi:DUF72 domain-containing protein [Variovorax sp. J22R24]|uniref:DUF72 domain-containing protein n=1 Tax=Variovorax gracilis TaxID=3053502 RepID=UPI002577E315|nr:DUF72 domain-containing protein [Variovorax sp. J22R24]MDM0107642.1 DUF72 domain-containing protein [Variovorax sp. J22R24]